MLPQRGVNFGNKCCWTYPKIVIGFFVETLNMVEKMEDKTSACGHILSNKKKFAWQKLKDVLNIKEPIHSQHGLKVSWDNF